jgi:outer membrane protein TolC
VFLATASLSVCLGALRGADDVAAAASTAPVAGPAMAMPATNGQALVAALVAAPTLERQALIAAVLAVNPGIAAARAGWRAAAARGPQQAAWDDPVLSYRFWPQSIASGVPYGQEIGLSQAIPLGGRTALRSAIALAEAEAARSDFAAVRLRLATLAAQLHADYVLAVRAEAIIARHGALVAELQRGAEIQLGAGGGSLRDPLQAEAEGIDLQQQGIAAAADRAVVVARLDGLLHRAPEEPLPPPDLAATQERASATDAGLQDEALRARPELLGSAAQEQGSAAALALARRQYLPEITVSASYSSMWNEREYRYGVGLAVALPVHRERLGEAVAEAEARVAMARLEREHMAQDIRVEVVAAQRRLQAATATAALVRTRQLPIAAANLAAARSAFAAGRESFATLLGAERDVRRSELRAAETAAEVARATAALAQATGRVPADTDPGVQP